MPRPGPSLPIDVIVCGLRIKKQSGVHTKAEREALVAMLRELPKKGYLALLEGLVATPPRWTVRELYGHYLADSLAGLLRPPREEAQPLAPLLERWVDTEECADGTRVNRRAAFRTVRDLDPHAPLERLPELLTRYRETCRAHDTPRVFNVTRTCCQAFLRDTVGKRHPLALAVADVPRLTERADGRPGLGLADAVAVRNALGGHAARIWWSMVLTGMGPKELWGTWAVLDDRVHIEGTKVVRRGRDAKFGRVRDVPLVDYPVRPELTRYGFASALRRLSERRLRAQLAARLERTPTRAEFRDALTVDGSWKITAYQARKSYARWLEDARIPRARREIYRGHGKRDIGDIYERYEVTDFLREDAKALRAILGPQAIALVP
jgi:hypothetical protein